LVKLGKFGQNLGKSYEELAKIKILHPKNFQSPTAIRLLDKNCLSNTPLRPFSVLAFYVFST